MSQDDRPFCEDCGIRSDLGPKCRGCYARWARKLWADIPDRLAEVTYVAKELNKLSDSQRKAVACIGLHKKPDVTLGNSASELVLVMKRSLEGPYGEQLLAKLMAIYNATSEAEKKRSSKQTEAD